MPKKSMEPQFEKIDAGDDDLFNRIIWFAMKEKESYPAKYSRKEEEEEDEGEERSLAKNKDFSI